MEKVFRSILFTLADFHRVVTLGNISTMKYIFDHMVELC